MKSSNPHEIIKGGAGVKVLLVDKDANSLMYMSSTLGEHSYEVTEVNSIFDALRMILEELRKFDLIISEIDMPGMDGFEFLKQITSKVDIPTILISTNDHTEVMHKVLAEGATLFYLKPISADELGNIWPHCLAKSTNQDNSESSLSVSGSENQNRKRKERSPPMRWTDERQRKFKEIYESLGKYKAKPSKIKELINEPDVTVKQISSYLQRFRAKLEAQEQEVIRAEPGNHQPNGMQNYYNFHLAERYARMPNLQMLRENIPNMFQNQFGPWLQRNVALGFQPWAPYMFNFQLNNGVGNFVQGLRPYMMPGLNGGLNMVRPNYGGQQRNVVHQRGSSINMAQLMDAEEAQDILYQSPDDDIGNAGSPSCSVNQPRD